jgi:hypothetical protein
MVQTKRRQFAPPDRAGTATTECASAAAGASAAPRDAASEPVLVASQDQIWSSGATSQLLVAFENHWAAWMGRRMNTPVRVAAGRRRTRALSIDRAERDGASAAPRDAAYEPVLVASQAQIWSSGATSQLLVAFRNQRAARMGRRMNTPVRVAAGRRRTRALSIDRAERDGADEAPQQHGAATTRRRNNTAPQQHGAATTPAPSITRFAHAGDRPRTRAHPW